MSIKEAIKNLREKGFDFEADVAEADLKEVDDADTADC